MMRYWCDGAGRDYEGVAKYAWVNSDGEDKVEIAESGLTNNEAEYMAVISAAEDAKPFDILITDSMLVVQQVNKKWRVLSENLRELNKRATKIIVEKNLMLNWTPRENNKAGHLLESLKK